MKVKQLIETLKTMPPAAEVRVAFDMGVRMDVEIVEEWGNQVVLTDGDEWDDRDAWGTPPNTDGMVEKHRFYDV